MRVKKSPKSITQENNTWTKWEDQQREIIKRELNRNSRSEKYDEWNEKCNRKQRE